MLIKLNELFKLHKLLRKLKFIPSLVFQLQTLIGVEDLWPCTLGWNLTVSAVQGNDDEKLNIY